MIITILLTAVALSMDAFAVSVCKGLAMKKISFGKASIVGGWFGAFQALMPLIGFYLGIWLRQLLETLFTDAEYTIGLICGIVAFVLLVLIGTNMIREACSKKEEEADASLAFGKMLVLAIATSIDALAVGVGYGLDGIDFHVLLGSFDAGIIVAALMIGVTTFILSAVGVKVGSVFGNKYEKKAELVGGIILILLGIKILLEGIGLIDLPI